MVDPLDRRQLNAEAYASSFRASVAKAGKDPNVVKQFARVAEGYAGLDCPSRARYHNLGNAYFLANQLPEAILAYQQGLRLDPNDAGLRANLDYARAKVQYLFGSRGRPEEDAWPPWLYRPSVFQVFVLTFVVYFLAWAVAFRWFMTGQPHLVTRALMLFGLAALGGYYWLRLENDHAMQVQQPLVIVREDKAPLRKGNGPSYPAHPELPMLARGMEARRLHERGGWLQIRFASGEVGWVEETAVLVDVP